MRLPEYDDILDRVAYAAAPLHPDDRDTFIRDALACLQLEPEPGPGTVNRIVRELLATQLYQRATIVSPGRPKAGPHHGYDHKGRRGRGGKPVKDTDDAA
jgi:hypothetical protein